MQLSKKVIYLAILFAMFGISSVYADNAGKISDADLVNLIKKVDPVTGASLLVESDNKNKTASILAIYRKKFSDSELIELAKIQDKPVMQKWLKEMTEIFSLSDKLILANQTNKKSTKKNSSCNNCAVKSPKQQCQANIDYYVNDIQKGIERYSRICDSNQAPANLDKAYNGNAASDNAFFTRVLSLGSTYDWIKKDNEYTYTCYQDKSFKRTYIYNPAQGTFKPK